MSEPHIVKTIHVSEPDDIDEVSGWIHDASFDWTEITFNEASAIVIVPFCQETGSQFDQREPELVKRGFLTRTFAVPYVRCWMKVRYALGFEVGGTGRDDPGMLNYVEFSAAQDRLVIHPVIGPEVTIRVHGLDVELHASDSVERTARRKVLRGWPIEWE